MRINFLVNEVTGGWKPTDKRLGGTEESVVRWADELVSRGYDVIIYDNDTRDSYSGGGDICINVKSSEVPPKEPTLYLTNETNATDLDLSAYDGVIWPSEWAASNIPVNNPRIFILPHGYDAEKINSQKRKITKRCLYASSPDRGLKVLEQIWPAIVEEHPDAHLYVTYGGTINTPNTTCGEFTEYEMDELFNTSEFWLHPCSGGELYGISGIKAQAAGAIPVYFPTMALAETVKGGVACDDAREMYTVLCAVLGNEEAKEAYRQELSHLKLPDWKDSTDRLEEIIKKVLK